MKVIKCAGRMFMWQSETLLEKLSTATHYGWSSAVCEGCGTRLYLNGGKLPDHWLTVTVHDVRGNIHNPELDPA